MHESDFRRPASSSEIPAGRSSSSHRPLPPSTNRISKKTSCPGFTAKPAFSDLLLKPPGALPVFLSPASPYASAAGTTIRRQPPSRMPAMPSSTPAGIRSVGAPSA